MKLALGLVSPELLVKDERVEKVFYSLQQMIKLPDGTSFVAYIQEPTDEEPTRLAVFMVTSAHPKYKGRSLITVTSIKYDDWRRVESSYRHYAGLSDPIRPIFAGTLRRHMVQYNNIKELI